MQGLLVDYYVAYDGKLTSEQQEHLRRHLINNLYLSTVPIQAYVLEEFGVELTCSALSKLLGRLGFVYKKTRTRPGGASAEKQEAFLRQHAELLRADGPPYNRFRQDHFPTSIVEAIITSRASKMRLTS